VREFLYFWFRCLLVGWKYGYGIFAILELVSGLVAGALLWSKKLKHLVGHWKDMVMKAAALMFGLSFAFSTLFIAPFTQFMQAKQSHIASAYEPISVQRREVANSLARVLNSGTELEKRFGTDKLPTEQDLETWGKEVENVLRSPELGEAYIARFNSSDSATGLAGVALVGHTEQETNRWKWLTQRNATLREFIKEFSSQK